MLNLPYVVNHVFHPPKLPQKDDYTISNETTLCQTVYRSVLKYLNSGHVAPEKHADWTAIADTLHHLVGSQSDGGMEAEEIESAFANMKEGAILAYLIREQNAAVIFRKLATEVIFEAFEVHLPAKDVMACQGKVSCSYPGPAISIPLDHFQDAYFRHELSSFLSQMDSDVLDSAATTRKAGCEVIEERDSAHPRYITALLTGILRGIGVPADVTRIRKRIADEVLWDSARIPWRRSMVWLIIRVVIQNHFARTGDNLEYKVFMIMLMCDILESAVKARMINDVLFCMRAKIAARVAKLGSAAPEFAVSRATEVATAVQRLLQARWDKCHDAQTRYPPWDADFLKSRAEADTVLTMRKSRQYILEMLKEKPRSDSTSKFMPRCSPHALQSLKQFEICSKSMLEKAFASEPSIALADIELSIQEHLDDWLAQNISKSTVYSILFDILLGYWAAASSHYVFQEDKSTMLLTLFELWVALDKAAIKRIPLLAEFSPEVPTFLLEPLLLKKSASLKRLLKIHTYLRGRHEKAKSGTAFTDPSRSNSFSVKFFDCSPTLQSLKKRIEEHAGAERRKKRDEYARKCREHKDLTDRALKLVCNKNTLKKHARYCDKCRFSSQAGCISISVHEWPLPSDSNVAKTVVFELACPEAFRFWRDATYILLNDVCQAPREGHVPTEQAPIVTLQLYSELRSWSGTVGRISLASVTKSFIQAHYKSKSIVKARTEKDILVDNGLSYKLYDGTGRRWPLKHSISKSCSVAHLCNLQLPFPTIYNSLQDAVATTDYTSNHVIANQHDCRDQLNIHEFLSFGTLRSGRNLQWLNIAKELRSRILTFHKEEVQLLLMQSAWQTGPVSPSGVLQLHEDLESQNICHTLLDELHSLLEDIQSNWMEAMTVHSAIVLCARILASTSISEVEDKAYIVMRRARTIVHGWMTLLSKDPLDATDEKLLVERQRVISEMALICHTTYDVDERQLKLLLKSPEDVSIFIECSIRRFDNALVYSDKISEDLHVQRLVHQNRRLTHAVQPILSSIISKDRRGLDQGIQAIWSGYRPDLQQPWKFLAEPNQRWITCFTGTTESSRAQHVCLNILDGQLLVDGKPLSRLPSTISEHATFKRVFGSRLLDIIPSDTSGLAFATRGDIFGYQVHFGMRGEELIIQAKNIETKDRLELVPHKLFFGDVPNLLASEYVHWLNLDQKEVEFRPLESCWVSSPENPRLILEGTKASLLLEIGTKKLVDVKSETFRMISQYLGAMEDGRFITVAYSPPLHPSVDPRIDVDLPRFRLSFTVGSDGNLESVTFPGMCVDDTEALGTLYGLKNMLILRPSVSNQLPRRVLIPHGKVIFRTEGYHVDVTIDTNPGIWKNVVFLEYTVRTDLGYLEGDGSLISHFYRAYLHALTSSCLPDPFLGRTGTEESLSILTSARSFSFQNLRDDRFLVPLYHIASLTPARHFYPEHLRNMQTIRWSDLPFLSQHPSFLPESTAILEYCDSLQKLRVDTRVPIEVPHWHAKSKKELWYRDYMRNFKLYAPVDLESTKSDRSQDTFYSSRDLDQKREIHACRVSSMIFTTPSGPFASIIDVLKRWKLISRASANQLSLSYSKDWLNSEILSSCWLDLYDLFRDSSVPKRQRTYQILFSLSALSYSTQSHLDLISALVQFTCNPEFVTLNLPAWHCYNLSLGVQPTSSQVSAILSKSALPFNPSTSNDSNSVNQKRMRYDQELSLGISEVRDAVLAQWPSKNPSAPRGIERVKLFGASFLNEIKELFQSCSHNAELTNHAMKAQAVLRSVKLHPTTVSSYEFVPSKRVSYPSNAFLRVNMDQVLSKAPPALDVERPELTGWEDLLEFDTSEHQACESKLDSFVQQLTDSSNVVERLLGVGLKRSTEALSRLKMVINRSDSQDWVKLLEFLLSYKEICLREHDRVHTFITGLFSPQSPSEQLLSIAGLWPRPTTYSLLRLLSYDQRTSLSEQWINIVKAYGRTLAEYQRSQRLLSQISANDRDGLLKEMENNRPRGMDDVDWLLIQISGNFLARNVQVDVAREMMHPSNSANTVLQLNMGEGKTSVIVPMIASSLANGHQLVRVVVLKALSAQMFQLLVDRVSGLVNRRVFYMPFSRRLKADRTMIETIQSLYEDCMRRGGILVVQPEHILSFRLMGLDRIVDSSSRPLSQDYADSVRLQLVKSYNWLRQFARDILDECDEILHSRYQLIYTLGKQDLLEDHPHRWITIQEVLSLLLEHIPRVKQDFPDEIHMHDEERLHKGHFPVMSFIGSGARKHLFSLIVSDILSGRLSNYPFERLPPDVKAAARNFICEQEVDESHVRLISRSCKGTSSWNGLLLLRGLIAYGVLAYALNERRWRVDYGLDERRTLLAVPYRAKDVPSLRAEFGHPDVAITLTCLCYYYQGITPGQLDTCFELLFKSDNPTLEYERWAKGIPEVPRTVNGINLRDPVQRLDTLIPYFSRNQAVVNFFLSEVVFPKYAKRFPEKLTTSGWDLAEEKANVTTGFSGTKDSQYLLPATISELEGDPLGQESTNARVLEFLLQPENNRYECARGSNNEPLTASEFLVKMPHEVRVLLDVGAQILDMTNDAVAKYWLELRKDVQAAVYFNARDQMMVVDRRGRIQRLIMSQYRNQLDKCIIYLDDAHTRGTDLKLPREYRAAVTLGPKVTKDRLIQGCMRMRKLGHGQSVMFFAPPKVEKKIREISRLEDNDQITSSHVLRWAYSETVADIEHHIPHWLTQGYDYLARKEAWRVFNQSGKVLHLAAWRQPDARSLEEMYGVKKDVPGPLHKHCDTDSFKRRRQILGCHSNYVLKDSIDEEQEREVSHEVERERQVQRPWKKEPALHSLSPAVKDFVKLGVILDENGFVPLLGTLGFPAKATHLGLLATKDFGITIRGPGPALDDYMRPITWIISGGVLRDDTSALVVISPFEADQLRSDIIRYHEQSNLHLHIYAPKVTQNQGSFDDLRFLAIPSLPLTWSPPRPRMMMQLNLFAGQLYLPDWDAYKRLCDYLGLYIPENSGIVRYQNDGFVKPKDRVGMIETECPFITSPLPRLKELFGLRRKGNGYAFTHIGKILAGRSLEKRDFE